jgi:hypothetical protein
VEDRPDQEALGGLAGDDGRAVVAPLEQAVAVVDPELALGVGLGGVAVVAVVDQERPDLLLEELDGLRVVGRGGYRGPGRGGERRHRE